MSGTPHRSFLRSIASLLLLLACVAGGAGKLQAQNFAGYDVSLHGVTYNYSYTDWNWPYVDYYYVSGSGNPAVFSGTYFSGVATVSHGGDEFAPDFSGFWTSGTFTDGHQDVSISESVTVNNHSYSAATRTLDYSLDGSGQLVSASYTVYSGGNGSIAVQIDASGNGSISGSDNGFVVGGSWYVNSVEQVYDDYRTINGGNYVRTAIETSYAMSSGSLQTSYLYTYSPADSSVPSGFTVSINTDGSGVISGNVTGYVLNGSWLVNGSSPITSPSVYPPSPLQGKYYNFSSGTANTIYQSDGSSTTSETLVFTSGAASLTIVSDSSGVSLSGNDPDYGSFTGTYNGSYWTGTTSRSAPSFVGATIYDPTNPIRFRYGTGDFGSNVTDTYTTDDNSLTVIISGDPANQSMVPVYANGTGGTFNYGTFNVPGYNLRTTQYTVTYTPHTSGGTFWVNGRQLNWTDGGDTTDSDGFTSSVSDNYSNGSTGDWMNISTIAPGPGNGSYESINIMVGGVSYWGSSNTGSFMWYNNIAPDITSSNPAISGGPGAFAIGYSGNPQYYEYFERVAPGSPYYGGSSGRSLKLTPQGGGSFQVHFQNASNPYGYDDYDFTYNGQPGVFAVTIPPNPNFAGTTVLAFTINNYEVDVPGTTPPADYPPAIYVAGSSGNYAFIGTAPDMDDLSVTDAYYAIPGLNWYGGGVDIRLFKIRLSDNSVVQHWSYTMNTYGEGYYDPATHLFHLDVNKPAFYMPTYGVDPLNNNLPWQLPTPPEGFPATALVNGEFWRFVNVDENGVLHYMGSYLTHTLTLTASTTREGVYDVVLTNPFSGGDTGEFHNFTFTMDHPNQYQVVSGTQTGSTINPTTAPRLNLAGSIDIFGNVLSMGALQDDPDTAGLTMSFADNLTTASLTMALSRPSSAWIWSHPPTLGSSSLIPAMKLNASHTLGLYTLSDASIPAIVLDPAGISSFKNDVSVQGTLRVKQRGDLNMGAFTNGPQP